MLELRPHRLHVRLNLIEGPDALGLQVSHEVIKELAHRGLLFSGSYEAPPGQFLQATLEFGGCLNLGATPGLAVFPSAAVVVSDPPSRPAPEDSSFHLHRSLRLLPVFDPALKAVGREADSRPKLESEWQGLALLVHPRLRHPKPLSCLVDR